MFESPVLYVYLVAVSVGVTLVAPIVAKDGLRHGFYSFMVGLSLVTGGTGWAMILRSRGQVSADSFQNIPPGMLWLMGGYLLCLVLRYVVMYRPSPRLREMFLWTAVIPGSAFLVGIVRFLPPPAGRVFAVQVDIVLSALLLGSIAHALILGHWYLVTPKLSLAPLVRLNRLTLYLLVARCVFVLLALIFLWNAEPVPAGSLVLDLFSGFGFLFFARVVLGLILPITLHNMIRVPLDYEQTQPATGLLYISSLFIVGCELGAAVMTWNTGIPV